MSLPVAILALVTALPSTLALGAVLVHSTNRARARRALALRRR